MQSIKTTARFAGMLYLLQIPLGIFGIVYVPQQLIDKDNLQTTMANIASHEFLFRLSMVSAILCALVTVGTGALIAKTLKPVNGPWSRWIFIFTCLVCPITLINELNHVAVLNLATTSSNSMTLLQGEPEILVNLFLNLHVYGIKTIDIFFGLWLLPMGYLVIQSKYIPKIIGYLLLLTCLGYLIDFCTFFLLPKFPITVSEYTWIGEVLMVLWLLIKGIDSAAFEKHYSDKPLHKASN